MASTFRRRSGGATAAKAAATSTTSSSEAPLLSRRLAGTKLWTGGITLTSSGLRDLDNLLGAAAGQPLGTCIWLEEDRWTNRSLALSLIKYWCAEAVSHGQHLVIPIDNDDTSEENDSSSSDHWDETNDDDERDDSFTSQLEEVHTLLDSLPRNLHWDRQQQKAEAAAAAATSSSFGEQQQQQSSHTLGTLEEEEGEEETTEEQEAECGLQIAWQYRKSVQEKMSGQQHHATSKSTSSSSSSSSSTDGIFCHSFDLQSRLKDQFDVNKSVHLLHFPSSSSCRLSPSAGFRFYRQIQAKLQELLLSSSSSSSQPQPRQVVRLLFYHSNLTILNVALPLLLCYIREHALPVVVLVATCPWKLLTDNSTDMQARRLLRRVSDVVLETEGFASRRDYSVPPEFQIFQGLLRVCKASTVTAATAISSITGGTTTGGTGAGGGGHFADRTVHKGPTADLYGLKRDRRKLHIQLLHIPPEDYAQGGGSVGGGGVRSGAGRGPSSGTSSKSSGSGGCGSGGGGGSALDF